MNWTEIMNHEMFDLCTDLKRCDISDILGGHFECDGELDELQMRKWAFLETLEKKSNTILGYVLLELSEMYDRRTGRPVALEEEQELCEANTTSEKAEEPDETTSEKAEEFEFEKLGVDKLIEIYALWKRKITNMKASSIPLDKRKKLIIDSIKKIMQNQPDEQNNEIIKTYFATKAPPEKKKKDTELSNYKVGDIVLYDAGKHRYIWIQAKVRKINEKSITIQLDEYRRINDLDALRDQTFGIDRLVWLNCFGGAKKVITDSKKIWSKSDCETRDNGYHKDFLRYFDEGAMSVDFGN